jgi:hypothetical protein
VVATNEDRNWLLTKNGGTPAKEGWRERDVATNWAPVLRRYATMQLGMLDQTTEFTRLGCTDLRTERLPEAYDELTSDVEALARDPRTELEGLGSRQLARGRRTVRELRDRLSELGLPDCLDHGDVHAGNVFVDGAGFRLFDWGDAAICPPIVALPLALHDVAPDAGLGAAGTRALEDAYLEPWATLASPETIRAAVPLARGLGRLCRAIRWCRYTREMVRTSSPDLDTFGSRVAVWLTRFIEDR